MKILIVQTSFLGDTILSTPVISGVKKLYPDSEIWMMTTPLSSGLVKNDPLLSGVIPYDKRGKDSGFKGLFRMADRVKSMNFDIVYSLHRSPRTSVMLKLAGIPKRIGFKNAKLSFLYHKTLKRDQSQHDVIRNLTILTNDSPIESFDDEMRLFAPEKQDLGPAVTETLPEEGSYAVLVPGSVWATKMWTTEGFRVVTKHLLDKDIKVVLTGGPDDIEASAKVGEGLDVIDLTGKTKVSELLHVVKNAKIVICNDSMPLHLASAFKIPTVVIFCSTIPEFGYGPWKNKSIIIEEKLSCRPCGSHGKTSCPKGTDACMKDISHDRVIDAVDSLLKN